MASTVAFVLASLFSSGLHNSCCVPARLFRQRLGLLYCGDNGGQGSSFSRREFLGASTLASSLVMAGDPTCNAVVDAADGTGVNKVTQEEASVLHPTIPFSSRRRYKHITLSNGLKVVLVSDKKALRAYAALSIGGAGQFQEDVDVGGLSHLMEHMVSSASKEDFEDWISTYEALSRFSELFMQSSVERICRDEAVVEREIQRVDSELDYSNDFDRELYLIKSLVNRDHPFSRFTKGSKDSLEEYPAKKKINVAERLIDFFKKRYQPSRAVLVVISKSELVSLEKWVSPFSSALSLVIPTMPVQEGQDTKEKFPAPLIYRAKPYQFVVWRPKGDTIQTENTERLTLHWFLDRHYDSKSSTTVLTSSTIGFFVSQLIDRRGPGSLYSLLLLRGWIPEGNRGLPRITFPIDISGFQMMRLEIVLTTEGFANRSAIIAAIYDSLQSVLQVTGGTFRVPDGLLKRYLSMARLFGYYIAPRPPDAIDLAVDAQTFGVGGSIGVGVPGVWPLLPEGDDPALLDELRKGIGDVLRVVVDPKLAIIIVTASNQAILESWRSIVDSSIPMPLSSKWQIEPLSRARYLEDDLMSFPGFVEEWIANRFIAEDEISPPVYNPLMPTRLRHPRPERVFPFDSREDSISERFATKTASGAVSSLENSVTPEIGQTWLLYQSTASGQSSQLLPVPMMPEELTPRCAVVVQLLSSRPPRATVKQAASAQLWLVSFEKEIQDLAELGGPAGLAYDISFNKYGLRICFLGISQNVLAYARRFCGRLVRFPSKLMVQTDFGPSVVEKTVTDANRQRSLSPMRRRRLESEIREASSQDAAREAKAFLASCTGAIFFVQGDVLPNEALNMAKNIKEFFDRAKGRQEEESTQSATPEISEILYRPQWRPRSAAICSIPGVPLISDACGRIPR